MDEPKKPGRPWLRVLIIGGIVATIVGGVAAAAFFSLPHPPGYRPFVTQIPLIDPAWDVEWRADPPRSHELLRDGVDLVTWWFTGVAPCPRLTVVREDGTSHLIESAETLKPFLRPIETPEQALYYSEFLRYLIRRPGVDSHIGDEMGSILHFEHRREDTRIHEEGDSAEYTVEEAEEWGVPERRVVEETEAGFVIRQVVYIFGHFFPGVRKRPPAMDVLMEERIGRDGSFEYKILRVLDPHARFQGLPRK